MNDDPIGPNGRLGMLDAHGGRQFIIPAEVKGKFKSLKRKLHFVLIFILLLLPWIYVNGRQLVLFNIPERRFNFFGLQLFAHNAPLIFFLIMAFVAGLALVTALWGRVWCGWACPQTVFIEAIFRQIEIWTEGNYIKRRQLRTQAWNFEKIRKVGLKWILYTMAASIISHSVIAYFTGSKELVEMISGSPSENLTYFVLVTVITGVLLFNFAWFREQFCVIMCPYGKFQAALMDHQTVTVMYDEARGEPRKGTHPKDQTGGDCVSCQRCVQVCPTKIDIRNGVQLECIACTACIDACDEIMEKVKKPKGLIRYKASTTQPINWFRPRVLLYAAILLGCLIGFSTLLATSNLLRVEVLRAKTAPFQLRQEEGADIVQNQFILRIENHDSQEMKVRVNSKQNIHLIIPENPVTIRAEQKRDVPLFVEFDPSLLRRGTLEVEIELYNETTQKHIDNKDIKLIGPIRI